MKQILFIAIAFFIGACKQSTKTNETNSTIDQIKLERYFDALIGKNASTTVYIVHPDICGACSNAFLLKMVKSNKEFHLFATGEFKPEHKEAVQQIKSKIRFVDGIQLARIGLNSQAPQKVVLKNGKIISVEVIEL